MHLIRHFLYVYYLNDLPLGLISVIIIIYACQYFGVFFVTAVQTTKSETAVHSGEQSETSVHSGPNKNDQDQKIQTYFVKPIQLFSSQIGIQILVRYIWDFSLLITFCKNVQTDFVKQIQLFSAQIGIHILWDFSLFIAFCNTPSPFQRKLAERRAGYNADVLHADLCLFFLFFIFFHLCIYLTGLTVLSSLSKWSRNLLNITKLNIAYSFFH